MWLLWGHIPERNFYWITELMFFSGDCSYIASVKAHRISQYWILVKPLWQSQDLYVTKTFYTLYCKSVSRFSKQFGSLSWDNCYYLSLQLRYYWFQCIGKNIHIVFQQEKTCLAHKFQDMWFQNFWDKFFPYKWKWSWLWFHTMYAYWNDQRNVLSPLTLAEQCKTILCTLERRQPRHPHCVPIFEGWRKTVKVSVFQLHDRVRKHKLCQVYTRRAAFWMPPKCSVVRAEVCLLFMTGSNA